MEHDGERIKSDSLHKKLPEEAQMRDDANDNAGKRHSARISRSKTNVGSFKRKKVKPLVFASQIQLNSTSVPTTPIAESLEDFSSASTSSYLLRHGSLDADHGITDEDRQQLASLLDGTQNSNNRDKMDHEEVSASCTSIEEENEQSPTSKEGDRKMLRLMLAHAVEDVEENDERTLTSKEGKRNRFGLMPDVEDVEENERTLTSKEGKMLAQEFEAYSRHNSDSFNAPIKDPKQDSRGVGGLKVFLDK